MDVHEEDNRTSICTMKIKEEKIKLVIKKLSGILNFLQDYLPLANVHSNDFIIGNAWEKYLSEKIREDVSRCTDQEILDLRLKMRQYQKEEIQNTSLSLDCGVLSSKNGNFTSSTSKDELPCKVKGEKNLTDSWKHSTIDTYVRDAARNSIPCSGVVCPVDDLRKKLAMHPSESLIIPNFMTSKKSHEVNIMSEICLLLANKENTDVIVDMGSGKGYLSTQLVYQHNLCVVAIDAQTSNTHGAQQRVNLVDKQWNAIVKQAEELKIEGEIKKKGKKHKKRLKQQKMQCSSPGEKSLAKSDISVGNCNDISEGTLADMQELLTEPNSEDMEGIEKTKGSSSGEELKTANPSVRKADNCKISYTCKENITCPTKKEIQILNCSQCGKKFKSVNNDDTSDCNNEKLIPECKIQWSHLCHKCKKLSQAKHRQLYYPLTMFVDDNVNVMDIVRHTGACSGEATLMLTGLHTCGALGSSIQRLYVNNPEIKVLCYVGCCYHLMKEEFVKSPFDDDDDGATPGFPMSNFLRHHKVGLGRPARNFASQTIYQTKTELKSKSFPRCLLQKILFDMLGFVDDSWKGLRKLEQKCSSMYQYVKTAFDRLNIPSEKVTPELVKEYEDKYKDYDRKLSTFLQIKSLLAPCIEAVILLDRYLYLLEQECTTDVLLVEMFDPVLSPRCHAIVAFKD